MLREKNITAEVQRKEPKYFYQFYRRLIRTVAE